MKTLIFSDTHLKPQFDKKKYEFLKRIIQSAGKVIINGDLWDAHYMSFPEFIQSDWNKLFGLLKSKTTVYLYGNHDKEEDCDERTRLFSFESKKEHIMKVGNKELVIFHGNDYYESITEKYPWLRSNKLILKIVNLPYTIADYLNMYVFNYMLTSIPNKNMIDKIWEEREVKKDQIIVCGHTHYPVNDSENNYINTGFIGRGKGSYVIIEDDKIELIEESY